jgi:hypothetical protein
VVQTGLIQRLEAADRVLSFAYSVWESSTRLVGSKGSFGVLEVLSVASLEPSGEGRVFKSSRLGRVEDSRCCRRTL